MTRPPYDSGNGVDRSDRNVVASQPTAIVQIRRHWLRSIARASASSRDQMDPTRRQHSQCSLKL